MLILPTGGRGIGVEAEGSNYPFVQPSADIQGLLADLWLSHERYEAVPPLRVTSLVGFQEAFDGKLPAAQIMIDDANGVNIFNSIDSTYYSKPWGPRLQVHEWLFADRVCRVVQHRAISESPPSRPHPPWPEEITPKNGVLDERTSELLSRRLVFLTVDDNAITDTAVRFTNGWNVNIASAPYKESLRNTTMLTLSANPGDGPGRHPGCVNPDVVVRTIGGIGPDNRGNFTLAAGDCYFVRQPITVGDDKLAVPTPATLLLGNDCGPCCDCDAFINVQRAILNVEADLRATAALAEATRDQYVVNSDRWNEQKACREADALQLATVGTDNTYIDINSVICNASDACLTDVSMEITVTTEPTVPMAVVPGTTYLGGVPYQPSGPPSGPLTAFIDAINPRNNVQLKMRFKHTGPGLEAIAMITTKSVLKYPASSGKPPLIKQSHVVFRA